MVDSDKGNLRSSVFFVWGGLCTAAFVYAYFLVPEVSLNVVVSLTCVGGLALILFASRNADQGTYARAGRSDVQRDNSQEVAPVGPPLDLRSTAQLVRQGRVGEARDGCRAPARRPIRSLAGRAVSVPSSEGWMALLSSLLHRGSSVFALDCTAPLIYFNIVCRRFIYGFTQCLMRPASSS